MDWITHDNVREMFDRMEAWLMEHLPDSHEKYLAIRRLDELRRGVLEDALFPKAKDYWWALRKANPKDEQ